MNMFINEDVVNTSGNSTGTRRERKKAETRIDILESARILFEQNGYEKTTIRDVAQSAGVGLGTVFIHFPDKKSLLIETIIDELEATYNSSLNRMPGDISIHDKLLQLAVDGYRAWLKKPALSKVILREMCFTAGPAQERLRKLDQQVLEQMTMFLKNAQKNGEIRKDVDPELAARTVFAVYLTTVLFWLDDSELSVTSGDQEAKEILVSERIKSMEAETRKLIEQYFQGIGVNKHTDFKGINND